jgi:hypothetical protein
MKRNHFLLFIIIMLPLFTQAQDRRYDQPHEHRSENMDESGSVVTIFSENGDQFFLVLNGVKQNNMPQTKVRVEDLPQVTNEIQIIFADNQTQEIQRRITFSDPVEGKAVNMVLKIERGQGGYARLSFVKSTPLIHDYRPDQGEYVMHYGRDMQQQTQVVINTPPPPPPGPVAMDPGSFNDAKNAVATASFEDTRLSTAKTIFSGNYMTTDQVTEICKLFSFEDTKLAFAKFAYSKTVDPNNYFKVGSVFGFDSNKQALNTFISSNPR